jgi:cytochrome b subunit of formate dehydrogenase
MEPNYRNYVIDILILASLLICAITGILKWPGFIRTLGLGLTVLPMKQVTAIHDWSGLLMIVLIAVHFFIHLDWLAAMTKKALGIKSRKN